MKISVIDLGFNSLKLVSYDVKQDNSFTLFDEKSLPARVGEGLYPRQDFEDRNQCAGRYRGVEVLQGS